MNEKLGIFIFGVLLGILIAGMMFLEIVTEYPELLP